MHNGLNMLNDMVNDLVDHWLVDNFAVHDRLGDNFVVHDGLVYNLRVYDSLVVRNDNFVD